MSPPLADLSEVVRGFTTGSYVVSRRGPPTMTNGRATPAAATPMSIDGMIAPLGGRDLLRVPEGERTTERRIFLTEVPLRQQSADGPADTLVADGDTWEVERVEDWFQLCGFYKSVLVKVGD